MKTRFLLEAAVIAAVYAAITLLLAPISYGPLQVRVSEALTVLPALRTSAIPGIFIGCLLANLIGPYGIYDVILGSLASLIAALLTYALRNKPKLAPLPPVIINGIIIGAMLHFVYGVPNLWACMGWVALGQLAACYIIGLPLLLKLKKTKLFGSNLEVIENK